MGLILSVIFVALIMGFIIGAIDGDWVSGLIGSFVTYFLCMIIPVVVLAASYTSYVDLRTSYDATVKQYRQAVTIYVDRAQIDVPKASLTDFKYEGYQGNVADFVRNLRREVVYYNEGIISKRIMKKNWFFNWLIVAPDEDMKVLNLVE
jgi:hypothetical protein